MSTRGPRAAPARGRRRSCRSPCRLRRQHAARLERLGDPVRHAPAARAATRSRRCALQRALRTQQLREMSGMGNIRAVSVSNPCEINGFRSMRCASIRLGRGEPAYNPCLVPSRLYMATAPDREHPPDRSRPAPPLGGTGGASSRSPKACTGATAPTPKFATHAPHAREPASCMPLNAEAFPGCHLASLASQRRRARRAPDLHLHASARTTPARTTTGWRRPKRTPRWTRCSKAA